MRLVLEGLQRAGPKHEALSIWAGIASLPWICTCLR